MADEESITDETVVEGTPVQPDALVLDEDEDIYVSPDDAEATEKKEEPKTEPAPVEEKQETKVELLPKFKTIEEQAKAYAEAEKAKSRAEQAAAEAKKLIDEYILSSLKGKEKKEVQEQLKTVFAEELGLDDTKVTNSILRIMTPIVEPLINKISELEGKLTFIPAETELEKNFPDREQIVESDDFRQWAMDMYPLEVIKIADTNPVLANKILTAYKKYSKNEKQPEVKPEVKKTEVVQPKPVFSEKPSEPSKPHTYTRRGLVELQQKDPEKYASMADEILKAYAEGRVK